MRLLCLFAVGSVCISPLLMNGIDVPNLKMDQRRELIRAGWQQLQLYDEMCKSYDIVSTYVLSGPGRTPERSESQLHVKVDLRRCCWLVVRPTQRGPVVVGRNPHYAFIIHKETGKDWCLDRQDKAPSEKNWIDQFIMGDRFLLYPLSTNIWCAGSVDRLDANYHITQFSKTVEGKVMIGFKSRRLLKPENKWSDSQGQMLVNPDLAYVAEAWRDERLKASRVFSKNAKGLPELLSMKMEGPRTLQTYVYSNYQYGPFDLEQCWLSHYGLPEPEGIPSRDNQSGKVDGQPTTTKQAVSAVSLPIKDGVPKYIWFLLAALGVASTAFLCHYLAKRLRARDGSRVAP